MTKGDLPERAFHPEALCPVPVDISCTFITPVDFRVTVARCMNNLPRVATHIDRDLNL